MLGEHTTDRSNSGLSDDRYACATVTDTGRAEQAPVLRNSTEQLADRTISLDIRKRALLQQPCLCTGIGSGQESSCQERRRVPQPTLQQWCRATRREMHLDDASGLTFHSTERSSTHSQSCRALACSFQPSSRALFASLNNRRTPRFVSSRLRHES